MQTVSVTAGQSMVVNRHSAPQLAPVLAQHDFVQDGVRIRVAIDRPMVDRVRGTWRCRLAVTRGEGELEQSHVVGASSGAVLEEALNLAAATLGVSAIQLLSDARVGLVSR
ncbi:hypothetical protein [Nocardia stercoris]|uniref:Uncharacterized protein n=1 Tax=Nocardia stercoris TaxID=2483361 RepID=A0A3M2KTY8_9NOCA|nr:hypothetical protein [Nocardia stercoris]RMI29107.1 hypothetical protein EBN03_27115 [Nocardia stercoris]